MSTQLALHHFSILTINYTYIDTSVIIVVTTNNPCHLTAYFTETPPKRHLQSRAVRGVDLPWGAYWCFSPDQVIEQQEPGDTLIHTFEKPNWLPCDTKWLTFAGTVNTQSSPSRTAIIEHHRPIETHGPPVWIQCPLVQNVIGGRSVDPDWNIVQTKTPLVWQSMVGEQIGTYSDGFGYNIRRNGIIWDTTSIPYNSIIVDAFMRRYGYYVTKPTGNVDFNCEWVDASPWLGTVNPSDYAIWNTYKNIIAQVEVKTTWTTRRWLDIPLTPHGLTRIIPNSLTKMVGLTDTDLLNVDPAWQNRDFYLYGLNPTYPQILHVQYRPPL